MLRRSWSRTRRPRGQCPAARRAAHASSRCRTGGGEAQGDFRSADEVAADAAADSDRANQEAATALDGLLPLDELLRALLDGGLQVAPFGFPRAAAWRIEPAGHRRALHSCAIRLRAQRMDTDGAGCH